MIVCPHCKTEQMQGTMFCSECGWDLQTSAPKGREFDLDDLFSTPVPPIPDIPPPNPITRRTSTNPKKNTPDIRIPNTNPPGQPIYVPPQIPLDPVNLIPQKPGARIGQPGLNFMVLNTGRLVECPRYDKVIIGRSDPTIEEAPDIDLTQDKAAELGVSRRHASLTFRDDQIFLTDLGSTNRTFINRKPLQREQPYEIHNGDEIRLGNIILKVILNEEFSLG
jgi:hypothetical protein